MTITAAARRLDDPSFVVDFDAVVGVAAVQLRCAGRKITTAGDQEFEDIATFCNPKGEAPGAVVDAISLEVLQSVGVGGLWNQLKPLEGQLVNFAFLWDGTVDPADDNPEMSGQLWIPFIPLVDAGPRKFSTFTLEFKILGTPIYTLAPPAIYAGHAA